MSNFVKFIEENILYEILAVSWLLLLWKYYLNLRQVNCYKFYLTIINLNH